MEHYNRNTIQEEPLPAQAKPIGKIVDADGEQKHRYSLRSER
jgi:hypothetical protein